ncbi:hypothetical protein CEXT_92781 [Caerostris extrusa]|uniref:Uncharacterized protein n=1 Tax=Caerostris extrusa TaxID=172846 RepID=A0AAV4P057_CAEEX|nr:hypothetical protein CEXT_92781 [Caerostris extrusa]
MSGGKEITVVSKPNSFSSPMQCDSLSITHDPDRATYNSSAKKRSLRGIMLAKIDHSRQQRTHHLLFTVIDVPPSASKKNFCLWRKKVNKNPNPSRIHHRDN